jgi:hypothetical protein
MMTYGEERAEVFLNSELTGGRVGGRIGGTLEHILHPRAVDVFGVLSRPRSAGP